MSATFVELPKCLAKTLVLEGLCFGGHNFTSAGHLLLVHIREMVLQCGEYALQLASAMGEPPIDKCPSAKWRAIRCAVAVNYLKFTASTKLYNLHYILRTCYECCRLANHENTGITMCDILYCSIIQRRPF